MSYSGSWYPNTHDACRETLKSYIASNHSTVKTVPGNRPQAIIAPHAGWYFSGASAATSYNTLVNHQKEPTDLVVLFGGHVGAASPHFLFLGEGLNTPLGPLKTRKTLQDELLRLPQLRHSSNVIDTADNAIEIHLPMIKFFFPNSTVAIITAAPRADAWDLGQEIRNITAKLSLQTVFIGSTDLTHYGLNYRYTPRQGEDSPHEWVRLHNDHDLLQRVVEKDPEGILNHSLENKSSCCPGAIIATLGATSSHPNTPRILSHHLSSDIRYDENFVGYGNVLI
ncbi:MAG: AmmeMemoRadiSam system protein B [Myxococcota bacterium]|nr:AmmeMemoRadiSam system protein B [Myxococcota bacterium]